MVFLGWKVEFNLFWLKCCPPRRVRFGLGTNPKFFEYGSVWFGFIFRRRTKPVLGSVRIYFPKWGSVFFLNPVWLGSVRLIFLKQKPGFGSVWFGSVRFGSAFFPKCGSVLFFESDLVRFGSVFFFVFVQNRFQVRFGFFIESGLIRFGSVNIFL